MNSPQVIAVGIAVIGFLLSGNLYFIKRLVDKLEETVKQHNTNATEVAKLSREVVGFTEQLREIKQEIKDLRRIEIEVAVLRGQRQQKEQPITES